jgi:hypothetical protein
MFKKISILFLLIAVLALSCTKDPTFVARNDAYNSNVFPTDTTQLFSVLIPAYASLRGGYLFGFEYRSHDLDGSDHIGDLNYNGDVHWISVTQNDMNSGNNYAHDVWQALYQGVQQTNTFFDRASFFELKYAKPEDLVSVNYMKGEAHFLRALYYFYLECFFGEAYITGGKGGDQLGVPLFSKTPQTLDSTQVARSTVRETWDFIINDLNQAVTLLNGVQWPTYFEGRANAWSAKALLGKVYVYTQDWTNAISVLQDVINNSGKTLMTYDKYMHAFGGDPANEFNEESLFELNSDPNETCYGVFCGDNSITTSEALPFGPTVIGDDGTQRNSSGTGYNNIAFHDRNLPRFGFNLPPQTLVKNPAYDPDPSKVGPNNPDSILDPNYMAASLDLRAKQKTDPRLYLNALQPWIDSVGVNDYGTPYNPRVVVRYTGLDNTYYGWSFHKYAQVDFNIFSTHAAASANVYILRMADMYLLYAEALAATGDNTNALEYLNKVKRRAYNRPINAASTIDYQSLTDNTSAAAAGDPVLGNNPLYYERWAELMNEANWWFDLCRWRIGDSEAAWYQKTFAGGAIRWNNAKSYVWPIPENEMANNKKMIQNPNY